MPEERRLVFAGRSKDDLMAFPASARRNAGHQLRRVQEGKEPADWKPMKTVGAGVAEIRIQDEAGAFRVIYIAKLEDAIHVLHCFQKQSQKTSPRDLAIATARYRLLAKR